MKPFLYIVAFIFLWFTAPIWVPIVGIVGMVGTGAAIVAANHVPAQAAPSKPSMKECVQGQKIEHGQCIFHGAHDTYICNVYGCQNTSR